MWTRSSSARRAPWISTARAQPLESSHHVDVAAEVTAQPLPGARQPRRPYRRSCRWQDASRRHLLEQGPVPRPRLLTTLPSALVRRGAVLLLGPAAGSLAAWLLGARAPARPRVEVLADGVRVRHLLLGTPPWIDRSRIPLTRNEDIQIMATIEGRYLVGVFQ